MSQNVPCILPFLFFLFLKFQNLLEFEKVQTKRRCKVKKILVDYGTMQCLIWAKNKNGWLRIKQCHILKKKQTFFLSKSNHLLVLKRSLKVSKALPVLYLLMECFHDTNPCEIKNKKKFFCVFFFKLSLKSTFWMSHEKRNCIEHSKTISKNSRLPIFFFSIFVSCLKIYLQHSKILYLTYKIFILNQFLNQQTSTHCITCNFIETKQKNSTFLHVFIFLDRESVTIKNESWNSWKRKFNIVS